MRFNDDSRTRLTLTVTTDFDPATATVEVKIDGTWYPAVWSAAATVAGTKWVRAARTSDYFAGPAVPTGSVLGAVVLTLGRHTTETRVISGGDTIVAESTAIDVS